MLCPKCHAEMVPISFEGIEIDQCSQCQGLWFDAGEADALKGLSGAEAVDTGDAAEGAEYNYIDDITCPRCSGTMVRMVDAEQPHIWYEKCHSCFGVFFDAGEFRDLTRYTLTDLMKYFITGERR